MRRALVALVALGAAACGRPEDVLHLHGQVLGVDGGNPTGLPVTLLRDEGATETGCGTFSVWKELEAGDAGVIDLPYLRFETTGREGPNRCLRLEWKDGESTATLSWLARDRDTLLPLLMTWFDEPGALPALPAGGSVLPQVPSFEISDVRGVIFRQVIGDNLTAQLLGPGFEPARDTDLFTRFTQRGQQQQADSISQTPFLPFDYRLEFVQHGFSGNEGRRELAHGSSCDVLQEGGSACALTDGLYAPIDLNEVVGNGVVLRFPQGLSFSTVIPRGLWALKPFTTLVLEGQLSPGSGWTPGTRMQLERDLEADAITSLSDPRQLLFPVVHWDGPPGPIYGIRIHLEDENQQPVAPVKIEWLAEISVY
jgi:hypothetical protein